VAALSECARSQFLMQDKKPPRKLQGGSRVADKVYVTVFGPWAFSRPGADFLRTYLYRVNHL
jgi:hypothetical protein